LDSRDATTYIQQEYAKHMNNKFILVHFYKANSLGLELVLNTL